MWREWVLGTVPAQLADLERILAVWHPDAIVCDPSMWGPFLILHQTRQIPVAIFTLVAACLLSGRDSPVLGMPMPRPRNSLQRLVTSLVRSGIGIFLGDIRRAANQLRVAHGLSPLRISVTDFAGQMALYLVPSSPEFDYQRTDLPSSVHYVGPCLWSKPSTDPPPDWLARFAGDPPLVYVTEGTIHLRPKVLAAAAQGLANRPLHVVMTTGRHRRPEELDLGPRPLAPNIQVEQWVPMADMLPYLDAVVTTGGPSTVLAALQQGIPLVIVPSDWDHPETGWRVADAGAGIMLKPAECTPERLRAVEEILREPSYRRNARRLSESFERCGGPKRAAELLEAMVQPSRSSDSRYSPLEPVRQK
jgi:MGT family glycosyltransferase